MHACACMCACACVCVCVLACACVCVCVRVCVRMCIYLLCVCARVCVCVCGFVCGCARAPERMRACACVPVNLRGADADQHATGTAALYRRRSIKTSMREIRASLGVCPQASAKSAHTCAAAEAPFRLQRRTGSYPWCGPGGAHAGVAAPHKPKQCSARTGAVTAIAPRMHRALAQAAGLHCVRLYGRPVCVMCARSVAQAAMRTCANVCLCSTTFCSTCFRRASTCASTPRSRG